MKKAILSLSIVAILTICMFNSVAATPVSKQTTDVHSNYAVDERGQQQTYLRISITGDAKPKNKDETTFTAGVGQNVYILGVLSSTVPTTSQEPPQNGIDAFVNIQSLNSDGNTWTTVATRETNTISTGFVSVKLVPQATGVYTYRLTYDGDSKYASAVSNTVTLTVTNVAIP